MEDLAPGLGPGVKGGNGGAGGVFDMGQVDPRRAVAENGQRPAAGGLQKARQQGGVARTVKPARPQDHR
ncbi:hypothetical protein MASR1M32_34020 [Rhodobacter sp.]